MVTDIPQYVDTKDRANLIPLPSLEIAKFSEPFLSIPNPAGVGTLQAVTKWNG
jgi:hypothetical protein